MAAFHDVVLCGRRLRVLRWRSRHWETRTRAHAHHIGFISSSDCPFYPSIREDAAHLFFRCPCL
jgi:hypothetical protein